jgi:D-beta-D-heptose 7-phosphate kinase/D-beta-D-heptose 1-phosphate adenosyltransferase
MKLVLAVGCFDCLHPGHIAHLTAARKLGHQLWVGLTVDEVVNKGKGRPVFPWAERCAMLQSLRVVSQVVANVNAVDTVARVRPNVYVKGLEYADIEIPEREVCERMDIKLVFLNTQPVYHSSDILSGELLRARIAAAGRRK